jgi:hypothetical protein
LPLAVPLARFTPRVGGGSAFFDPENHIMKTCLTLLMSLCLVLESHARLMQAWSCDTLNDKATLVVIATPTSVVETSELAALPNITTVYTNGTHEAVMGNGVETSFKVLTVLKGERDIKQLVLHHFALASAPANRGPSLVSFKPDDNKQFLMFLQKEPDGRYVAVYGQTDPQVSIAGIENNFPVR